MSRATGDLFDITDCCTMARKKYYPVGIKDSGERLLILLKHLRVWLALAAFCSASGYLWLFEFVLNKQMQQIF